MLLSVTFLESSSLSPSFNSTLTTAPVEACDSMVAATSGISVADRNLAGGVEADHGHVLKLPNRADGDGEDRRVGVAAGTACLRQGLAAGVLAVGKEQHADQFSSRRLGAELVQRVADLRRVAGRVRRLGKLRFRGVDAELLQPLGESVIAEVKSLRQRFGQRCRPLVWSTVWASLDRPMRLSIARLGRPAARRTFSGT